jgi:hypothetical protein
MRWLMECQNAIQWGNSLRLELFKSKYRLFPTSSEKQLPLNSID